MKNLKWFTFITLLLGLTGILYGQMPFIGSIDVSPYSVITGDLQLDDSNNTDELTITWDDNDTSDRTLGLKVNGANAVLQVEGVTAVIDQDLSADASPLWADIVLTDEGELRLREASGGGVNYTGFKAPAALAGNVIYDMPDADGNAGEVLSTNGGLALSWIAPLINPMTAVNDVIVGGAGGAVTRVDTDLLGNVAASLGTQVVTFDFTAGADEDIVEWNAHTLANWDRIYFTNAGGSLPAEISSNTLYYVINETANYFQVTATLGGAILEFTDDGAATSTVYYGGLLVREEIVTARFSSDDTDAYNGVANVVDFETTDWDSYGAVSAGPWKFNIPRTGTYIVCTYVQSGAMNVAAGNNFYIAIYIDGGEEIRISQKEMTDGENSVFVSLSGCGDVQVAEGSFLQLAITTPLALTLNGNVKHNWVTIRRVGD